MVESSFLYLEKLVLGCYTQWSNRSTARSLRSCICFEAWCTKLTLPSPDLNSHNSDWSGTRLSYPLATFSLVLSYCLLSCRVLCQYILSCSIFCCSTVSCSILFCLVQSCHQTNGEILPPEVESLMTTFQAMIRMTATDTVGYA